MNLCRAVQYTFLKKDEVVFYEGDTGRKFYIILEGGVNIWQERQNLAGNKDLEKDDMSKYTFTP